MPFAASTTEVCNADKGCIRCACAKDRFSVPAKTVLYTAEMNKKIVEPAKRDIGFNSERQVTFNRSSETFERLLNR